MVLFLDDLKKRNYLLSFIAIERNIKLAISYLINNIKLNKNIFEFNNKSKRSSYNSLIDLNTSNHNSEIAFPAYCLFKNQAKPVTGSVTNYWIYDGTFINFGAIDNTLITHEIGISEGAE